MVVCVDTTAGLGGITGSGLFTGPSAMFVGTSLPTDCNDN